MGLWSIWSFFADFLEGRSAIALGFVDGLVGLPRDRSLPYETRGHAQIFQKLRMKRAPDILERIAPRTVFT